MKIFGLFLALFCSSQAFGYLATMDNGDILPEGTYRAMVGPQYSFDGDNSGTTLSGRFDMGATPSSNIRALFGVGEGNFYTGAFYKWMPYPDFGKQPALGIMSGITYAHANYGNDRDDIITVRVHPIISKKFETQAGAFTPYASLPIGISFAGGDTFWPIQLAGGTEYRPPNWNNNISFWGELGLDVNKSFSYIELAISYTFGEDGKK